MSLSDITDCMLTGDWSSFDKAHDARMSVIRGDVQFRYDEFFHSLKWFQWLYLTGTSSRLYPCFDRFFELFENVRFDWVTKGVL